MSADQKPLLGIPTNVISGFLGVGKTSAILNLLSQKLNHFLRRNHQKQMKIFGRRVFVKTSFIKKTWSLIKKFALSVASFFLDELIKNGVTTLSDLHWFSFFYVLCSFNS